jgi:predicted phosphodiesterase
MSSSLKFALISDLHLEFFEDPRTQQVLAQKINSLVDDQGVDLVINAGDIHPQPKAREFFHSLLTIPYVHILGNHDFYGKQTVTHSRFVRKIQGLKIAGCTLWTDFKKHDPLVLLHYRDALVDARQILFNAEKYDRLADEIYQMHLTDLAWLTQEKPDIVVTHHGPSRRSIHPHFLPTGDMNYYFVSELENFIFENSNIKIWLHGHVHDPFDYMIDNTRILCNPFGYPRERFYHEHEYQPITFTID